MEGMKKSPSITARMLKEGYEASNVGTKKDPNYLVPNDWYTGVLPKIYRAMLAAAPQEEIISVSSKSIIHLPAGHRSAAYNCRMAMIPWDDFERLIDYKSNPIQRHIEAIGLDECIKQIKDVMGTEEWKEPSE